MLRAIAVALAVFMAVVPAAEARTKKKPRCSTAGKTLAASKDMRVYTRGRELDPVYACARWNGRRLWVAHFGECMSTAQYSDALIDGRYLAVRWSTCGLEFEADGIDVWDMRRRKRVHRTPESFAIGDFVLAPDGRVAWVASDSVLEVRRITPAGAVETLDSGADIAPGSLALSRGGTLYWKKGAALVSATL